MHSKAPFKVTGQSDGGKYIRVSDANGKTVARVPFSRAEAPASEITDADNAKLFAAAPQLLAALKAALPGLHVAARAENVKLKPGPASQLFRDASDAIDAATR